MNIDVSDDASTWTSVVTSWTVNTPDAWVEKTFSEVTGRYVRLYMINCSRPFCNIRDYSVQTRIVNPPAISVTPASLSFGNVNIGLSSYLDFTIQNTGGGTLSGSVTGLAAPFSCTSGCSYNLSGGASQTATIQFSPTSAGSFSDTADFSGGGGVSRVASGTGVTVVSTCQNHNVSGWAWAGAPQSVSPQKLGLGWASFSCKNLNTGANYGVDIEADGNLVGYAYYDMNDPNTGINEIGWIDFNPSLSGRPGAPNSTAKVDLDGNVCGSVGCVYGWARAVGYGDGWDGWIKLRKDSTDGGANYGVYIDTDDGEFHGWAWGGDVMGWISFNCDNQGTSCGVTNDHKVQTNFSFSSAPVVSDFRRDSTSYCTSIQKKGHIDFSWLYTGDNPQAEYKIDIAPNPGFGGGVIQEFTIAQSVAPGSRGTSGVDVVPLPTVGQKLRILMVFGRMIGLAP
ncbi:MAG: choice-of-anchor D domain-containing protein [Candidatus Parcubacteria bacterium]|nr:choice-of-anchor D domain-containing protein [Candidatus Parcubacteria bacterium]